MKRAVLVGFAAFVLSGCESKVRPMTESAFKTAQLECGARDAYLMNLPNRKGIGFKGFSPAHAEQAKCLVQKLKGTDASIAFISEPPV